jgi:hypothetical protein
MPHLLLAGLPRGVTFGGDVLESRLQIRGIFRSGRKSHGDPRIADPS